MEEILRDVNAVVGVTGSFVCDDEGHVLAQALPDIFDADTLSPVGRTLVQTIAGLETTNRRKVGDIDLLYDQGRLLVKNLGNGCLCILCARRINVPLLNLTANVAARKLSERIKESKPAVARAPTPRVAPEPEIAAAPAAAVSSAGTAAQAEPQPEQPVKRMTRAEIMAANVMRGR